MQKTICVLSPWSKIFQNSSAHAWQYELLIALLTLELALAELEIQKHVQSTQYQFWLLKNITVNLG